MLFKYSICLIIALASHQIGDTGATGIIQKFYPFYPLNPVQQLTKFEERLDHLSHDARSTAERTTHAIDSILFVLRQQVTEKTQALKTIENLLKKAENYNVNSCHPFIIKKIKNELQCFNKGVEKCMDAIKTANQNLQKSITSRISETKKKLQKQVANVQNCTYTQINCESMEIKDIIVHADNVYKKIDQKDLRNLKDFSRVGNKCFSSQDKNRYRDYGKQLSRMKLCIQDILRNERPISSSSTPITTPEVTETGQNATTPNYSDGNTTPEGTETEENTTTSSSSDVNTTVGVEETEQNTPTSSSIMTTIEEVEGTTKTNTQ